MKLPIYGDSIIIDTEPSYKFMYGVGDGTYIRSGGTRYNCFIFVKRMLIEKYDSCFYCDFVAWWNGQEFVDEI
jgi:hypothetical protein